MLRLTMTALLATALVPGVALAQSGGSASSNETKEMTSAQNTQSIPQELKDQLKEEGFSDVQIVPGSFLIAAKNEDGDPVRMVVGPHSVTMLTLDRSSQSSTSSDRSSTTGSDQSSTGAGMAEDEQQSGASQ